MCGVWCDYYIYIYIKGLGDTPFPRCEHNVDSNIIEHYILIMYSLH